MTELIGMHGFQGVGSPPTGTKQIFWPPEYGGDELSVDRGVSGASASRPVAAKAWASSVRCPFSAPQAGATVALDRPRMAKTVNASAASAVTTSSMSPIE